MKMTFRWYGSAIDPIPLKFVKQIPGMTGLMGLLMQKYRTSSATWSSPFVSRSSGICSS